MLRPRIIPCLLIHDRGLVKSHRFRDYKYVGDPINAVKIFNEKEVDELIVLDIDATVEQRAPDFELIAKLAAECRMPLCYGGGVSKPEHALRLISVGVEKVAISSAAVSRPELISETARLVGSQSVVLILDVAQRGLTRKHRILTHNGSKTSGVNLSAFISNLEALGAGELVINNVDRDGVMNGYDMDLVEQVRNLTDLPLTVLGGAGSTQDIEKLTNRFGIIGAAAGSLFVFKGRFKAVLINYPQFSTPQN